MTRLKILLPDGTTATRRTERPYTHAVVIRSGSTWALWSCHESHFQAVQTLRHGRYGLKRAAEARIIEIPRP